MLYQQLPAQPRTKAGDQFDELYRRARWGKVWSRLTRHNQQLLCMSKTSKQLKISIQRHGGTRSVPLAQIRGSVGRCSDFDRNFRPLHAHIRERWIGVAVAYEAGVVLPAVDLVQVNGTYFVIDGHHRISVARKQGQVAIDANVVVLTHATPVDGGTPVSAPARSTPPRRKAPVFQQVVNILSKMPFARPRLLPRLFLPNTMQAHH